MQTDEERDRTEDAEATVDKPPEKWDTPNWSRDEGERNHRDTGNDSELKNPFVADRIAQGPNEDDRQNKMGEGKPVGSIGQEGVSFACVLEGGVDSSDPSSDRVRKNRMI